MYRGTSPTLIFSTPYDAARVTRGSITLAQNGVNVLEYDIHSDAVRLDDQSISVLMTQEESLKLNQRFKLQIQLRLVLDDEVAVASNIITTDVEAILKDGVI